MPVNIDIYNGANKTRHRVWIQNPVDTFTFDYTTRPDLINFDGDKILLCQKTDHKTADNYKAQWKYAPLYVDRREAIEYFADNNMINDLSLGLNDKYYGIRGFTLDKMTDIPSVLSNAAILQTVERIAQNDEHNRTKARAVSMLAATKDPKYKYIFDKAINDSSYAVAGAALEGLSTLDTANAYALAKKYSGGAKGDLAEVAGEIIVSAGKEEDYDIVAEKYDNMPPGQEKFSVTPSFCDYLSKLNDEQKIEKGIDLVIKFKNSVPKSYRSLTDPTINAGLQKIASVKGGNVQAYVANAIKQ
jgi:aminopeptidase N